MENTTTKEEFIQTMIYVLGDTLAVNNDVLDIMWKIYKKDYDKRILNFYEIRQIREEALKEMED